MLAWALLRLLARLDNEHRERLADAARLKERHALSQMLQDGVLQHMYAVGLRLEGVQDLLDHDPERARTELAAAMVALRGAISRVREHLEDGDKRDAD